MHSTISPAQIYHALNEEEFSVSILVVIIIISSKGADAMVNLLTPLSSGF